MLAEPEVEGPVSVRGGVGSGRCWVGGFVKERVLALVDALFGSALSVLTTFAETSGNLALESRGAGDLSVSVMPWSLPEGPPATEMVREKCDAPGRLRDEAALCETMGAGWREEEATGGSSQKLSTRRL
jgi:hypothetical protein